MSFLLYKISYLSIVLIDCKRRDSYGLCLDQITESQL